MSQTAKDLQNYQVPTRTACCGSCTHLGLTGAPRNKCKLGGFAVELDGLCDRHEFWVRKRRQPEPAPEG